MFKRASTPSESATSVQSVERITSVLGPGVIWHGAVSGSGGVRIEGAFEGQIALRGMLVVGETGRVTCENVRANTVVVAGAVRGNITTQKLEIRSTGRVWGDVVTTAFVTDEGAFLRGQIRMEETVELDLGRRRRACTAGDPSKPNPGRDAFAANRSPKSVGNSVRSPEEKERTERNLTLKVKTAFRVFRLQMRYSELQIETQRQAPARARSEGAAFLDARDTFGATVSCRLSGQRCIPAWQSYRRPLQRRVLCGAGTAGYCGTAGRVLLSRSPRDTGDPAMRFVRLRMPAGDGPLWKDTRQKREPRASREGGNA